MALLTDPWVISCRGGWGGARLIWLDLACGLAVVSLIIAHTGLWGGVLVGSEYLTAPWFAVLIGISLLLAWEKAGRGAGVFIVSNVDRIVVLVVVVLPRRGPGRPLGRHVRGDRAVRRGELGVAGGDPGRSARVGAAATGEGAG